MCNSVTSYVLNFIANESLRKSQNEPARNHFFVYHLVKWCGSRHSITSSKQVRTPSNVPNSEPTPSASNIRKKSTDQRGGKKKLSIASVNAINAKPVPPAACSQISEELYSISFQNKVLYQFSKVNCLSPAWNVVFEKFKKLLNIKQRCLFEYLIIN